MYIDTIQSQQIHHFKKLIPTVENHQLGYVLQKVHTGPVCFLNVLPMVLCQKEKPMNRPFFHMSRPSGCLSELFGFCSPDTGLCYSSYIPINKCSEGIKEDNKDGGEGVDEIVTLEKDCDSKGEKELETKV